MPDNDKSAQQLYESELDLDIDGEEVRNETVRVEYLWMDFYGATL